MLQFFRVKRLALLSILLLSLPTLQARADILHLELGAANYSEKDGDNLRRFDVLGREFQKLVGLYGEQGTVYLNDIDESGLQKAVTYARQWFGDRHYQVEIVPLAGDYTKIQLPFVKSMTLNNPGYDQLPVPEFHTMREESKRIHNRALVEKFETLSDHSETGLKITSYYNEPAYPAMNEFPKWVKRSEFVLTGELAPEYVGPAGQRTSSRAPAVYYLKPKCGPSLRDQRPVTSR